MDPVPTKEELSNIKLCAQKLWDLDTDRLQPGKDYEINPQRGTDVPWTGDAAKDPLFSWVTPTIWERKCFGLFYKLLDNYVKERGVNEVMTPIEETETRNFIKEIMESLPMQYVQNYLAAKNFEFAKTDEAFGEKIFTTWFGFISRDSERDSSGFEHVFLGEVENREYGGFHNWIRYYVEESQGNVNYRGFIFPRWKGPNPDREERLMQLQFEWDGKSKNITSMFIGSSPAFELALYTLYFIAGVQDNNVELLNYKVDIVCYKNRDGTIGSTYPKLTYET